MLISDEELTQLREYLTRHQAADGVYRASDIDRYVNILLREGFMGVLEVDGDLKLGFTPEGVAALKPLKTGGRLS